MAISIGLNPSDLKKLVQSIREVLSDTVMLSVKIRGFHWNVVGKDFWELHELFELQYKALNDAADVLAERIRALGEKSPGSFIEFTRLSQIKEVDGLLSPNQMIEQLIKDHESTIQRIREHVKNLQETNDFESIDMLTGRLYEHGKFAWMVRSYLS